jgi:hypothetical protein
MTTSSRYEITSDQPHHDCADCRIVGSRDRNTDRRAAGIRLCAKHRATVAAESAARRAADPQLDAVHAMIDRFRTRTGQDRR